MTTTGKRTLKFAAAAATLCFVAPTAFGQGIGELTLADMMTSTPQKLERGAKVWNQNCVECHGASGAGDGASAMYFSAGVPNLVTGEYRHGGGPLQVHNMIARGDQGHPLFEHLPYQDLWAVTHHARSLSPVTKQLTDPPELLTQAKFEAREGMCNPAVKASINDKMKFLGDSQVKRGEAVFATNCSSCHGAEGKGDGSAAASLSPPPRNFTSGEGWTNGTSALAVFNTLASGIEGTSMAGFKHLPEADRWAMTHLVREKWLPAASKADATPEELEAVCRALSGGGSGATLDISDAMKFVVDDVEEQRVIRMARYGTAWVEPGVNTNRGQQVYESHCLRCHGPRGVGTKLGPYGSQPPYLVVKVNKLEPGLGGGTYTDFARRSIGGAHVAIPDVTGASHIAENDWRALHAYVTSFEGAGEVRPVSERPAASGVVPPDGLEGSDPSDGTPTDGAATDEPAEVPSAPKAKPEPKPEPTPAAKPKAKPQPAAAAAPDEQPAKASEEQ